MGSFQLAMANALPEGSVNLICQRDHLCSGRRTEHSPAVVKDSQLQWCCMNTYPNPAEMSFILQMLPFGHANSCIRPPHPHGQ